MLSSLGQWQIVCQLLEQEESPLLLLLQHQASQLKKNEKKINLISETLQWLANTQGVMLHVHGARQVGLPEFSSPLAEHPKLQRVWCSCGAEQSHRSRL
jgi:hypothetical protein